MGNRGNARNALIGLLVAAAVLAGSAPQASAFTADSPEVKKLIDKGTKFLETADDARLGGKCLIGMVFLKHGKKDDHPKVAAAVEACKVVCKLAAADIKEDVYSTGIAIIFLCDCDASKYRPEIVKLMESLEIRQRAAGGWGYPAGSGAHGETGDTSMTQYAVLATWSAYRNGIDPSQNSVENVCNWLLRTQDPSGGFGYQGVDPGEGNYVRVAQSDVRNSLCAAGAGSLYICADLLRFKAIADPAKQAESDLPPALVLVDDGKDKAVKGPVTERVPSKMMMRGLNDANGWMARNYKIDQGAWNLYHLYALERYQSFRELAENLKDEEPKWYNDGVRHLTKTMSAKGTWESNSGEVIDTAFGVLFLMRSTKKTIQKTMKRFGHGQLTGGRGLPTDASSVTVKHGRVVGSSIAGEIDDLVAVLEAGEGSNFEYVANNVDEVKLSADEATRKQQIIRLRRLAAAGPFESRLVAVKMLARSRDFDSAPVLIYAMTDPDARIVREADAGLRFMARRFGDSKLPDKLTNDAKKKAADAWTKWYVSIRPDAEVKK
jgi:hypothetical protein